jgi:hypothetical protein
MRLGVAGAVELPARPIVLAPVAVAATIVVVPVEPAVLLFVAAVASIVAAVMIAIVAPVLCEGTSRCHAHRERRSSDGHAL